MFKSYMTRSHYSQDLPESSGVCLDCGITFAPAFYCQYYCYGCRNWTRSLLNQVNSVAISDKVKAEWRARNEHWNQLVSVLE